MSLFSWFGKKSPAPESEPQHSSGLGQADATVPMYPSRQSPAQSPKRPESSGSRSERLERRELLYAVVRECMTAAGVLSSTYKFKVLSLDATGRKYLIMVDIPQVLVSDPARFAEIEGSIARSAKERFGILVTAVYWRINEVVGSGTRQAPTPAQAARAEQSRDLAKSIATPTPSNRDAVLEEEVQAFKRAVASAASAAAAANRSGEMTRSGRRNPQPMPDFSDTEPFEASSPLGPSQFGGLN